MRKILVVGDCMIDRYWFGDVSRLSQEAPVPVVRFEREDRRAGAAANVALNCQAMGAKATLLSSIGNDEYSFVLESLVPGSYFIHHSLGTTQKLRVIGKQQQIVRIDFDCPVPEVFAKKIVVRFDSFVDDYDIIVFSDYGKGALRYVGEMIQTAREKGKTILVDPKGHNYKKYAGADLIKPNLDEMRAMVGGWDSEDELAHKVDEFMYGGDFQSVLLTRASEGMTLFERGKEPFHVHAETKNVFDVTGAGDTAIAAFAVALYRGERTAKATTYANKASGVVVGKFGTAIADEQEVFGSHFIKEGK